VNFRGGLLCWAEHDIFDDAAHVISFNQSEGDFDRFEGTWTVHQRGDAVAVRFEFPPPARSGS